MQNGPSSPHISSTYFNCTEVEGTVIIEYEEVRYYLHFYLRLRTYVVQTCMSNYIFLDVAHLPTMNCTFITAGCRNNSLDCQPSLSLLNYTYKYRKGHLVLI